MPSTELTVKHPAGLHARPAADFVKTASAFPCDIQVCNLTTGSQSVNAKSILSVLTLGVNQGHRIKIDVEGEGADEALAALTDLIESDTGEDRQ